MKKRLISVATAVSAVLLAIVIIVGVGSYWRCWYAGPSNVTWFADRVSGHSTVFYASAGRVGFQRKNQTLKMEGYLPEKWALLSAEAQKNLLAFKAANPEFHGWYATSTEVGFRPARTTLYNSILGLEYIPMVTPGSGWSYMVAVPTWMVAAVLGILPLRRLTRKRPRRGCCTTCDYDLRAHGPGQRCPECGTAIGVAMGA